MASQQKEYELLFKLKAALGNNFGSTFKTAITTTKQLQGTLEKVNKVQGQVEGYKKQETALQSNKTKLEKLNTQYSKLQQELEATGKPTKELERKLESTERQIKKTTTKISEQENKLASLGKELRSAGISTGNLEKENQKLQKSYERVKKAQEEMANISNLQEKNRQAIAGTRTELLKTGTVVTAVGAAIYQGPVKSAAEFQEQMSTVKAISGALPDDMTKIIAKAKEMGATTKFSAVEAGKAFEYMGMAGWKADDMLEGIEAVMNLAAASGEELAIVSDIVTDAMSAFGLEAKEAARFADVLAAASTSANTNVAMLGESFKYAAPLAGTYGFSVEDTALMLSLMANNGIKASQSGTSLRKILAGLSSNLEIVQSDGSKFVVETANMDGSMRSLKDIIGDVRVAFNGMSEAEKAAVQNDLVASANSLSVSLEDENGKLKTQAELYADVTKAMDGLTDATKVAEAESLADKTAMAGLLSIINTSEEDYEKLAEAIYDSKDAAEEMAKIRLDNFNGQMELAGSAVKAMNIALGEALLPYLTTMIQKATALISQFAIFAEQNPELVQTLFKVAGALTAIKLASVVTKLGFLEMKGGILAAQKVFALFKGKAAMAAVESVALKGKLTAAGTGIKSYFSCVGGAMGDLVNSNSVLKQATAAGKGAGNKIVSGISRSFGKLTGSMGKALSKVGAVIYKSPLGKIGDIVSKGAMKASVVFVPLGNVISTALAPLGKLGGSLLGGFGGVLGKMVPIVGVISLIVAGIQLLKNNLESVRGFIQKIFGDAGLEVFDKVVSAITNIGEVIKGVFSEGNLENARSFIQDIFGEQGAAVFDGLITLGKSLINVFQGFWSFVETNITPMLQNLFNL
ncbi:MAG: phage tail tape measure protein, partial [Acidaminococcaceae bacterium]